MVVIAVDKDYGGGYQERSQRLVDSLNKTNDLGTIKADIFILSDGCLHYVEDHKLFGIGNKAGGRSMNDLKKFAKRVGYTQICLVESTEI
jgi:hypothetical protein